MKRDLSIIFVLIIGISLLGFLSAECSSGLGLPNVYHGSVYVDEGFLGIGDSELLVGEYSLVAEVGGQRAGEQTIIDGSYEFDVSPCIGLGGEISFFVNGVEIERFEIDGSRTSDKPEYNSTSVVSVEVDLILKEIPPIDLTCGDGDFDGGEECDDGNLVEGDGCSISCEVEYGHSCSGQPSVCEIINTDNTETQNNDDGTSGGNTNSGGGGGSTKTSSSSTPQTSSEDSVGSTALTIDELNEIDPVTTSEEPRKGFFKLTGNAVSEFSKTNAGKGVLAVVFAFLTLGVFMYISSKRKSKALKKSKN